MVDAAPAILAGAHGELRYGMPDVSDVPDAEPGRHANPVVPVEAPKGVRGES